jgi:hypothetical protein
MRPSGFFSSMNRTRLLPAAASSRLFAAQHNWQSVIIVGGRGTPCISQKGRPLVVAFAYVSKEACYLLLEANHLSSKARLATIIIIIITIAQYIWLIDPCQAQYKPNFYYWLHIQQLFLLQCCSVGRPIKARCWFCHPFCATNESPTTRKKYDFWERSLVFFCCCAGSMVLSKHREIGLWWCSLSVCQTPRPRQWLPLKLSPLSLLAASSVWHICFQTEPSLTRATTNTRIGETAAAPK